MRYTRSILGGICISIGAIVNLSCENRVVGAFLFGIGLFAILSRGYQLFTGAIGYYWQRDGTYKTECVTIWVGNYLGTIIMGILLRFTRIYGVLSEKISATVNMKLQDHPVSIFLLSVLCGMLMYIAVHGWNTAKNSMQKIVSCFLPVMVFILAGFEHCVANMAYFWMEGGLTWRKIIYLIIMTIGNSVGAWILSVPEHWKSKKYGQTIELVK
jgi:formate/nitrite transporter FocA (FNT family)